MCPSAPAGERRRCGMNPTQSIQDQVYQALRQAILNLSLIPGHVMSTQEMAGLLGVSRTPVREAFIRLQRDGLVVIQPQRDTVVTRIDMARVRQERFMRVCLERAALADFVRRKDFSALSRLSGLIEKQMAASVENRNEDFLAYDDEFHQIIFETAGQALSWDIIAQTSTHHRRVRLLSLLCLGTSEAIVVQHQEILRALENDRVEDSQTYLDAHLTRIDEEEGPMKAEHEGYFLSPDGPGGLGKL